MTGHRGDAGWTSLGDQVPVTDTPHGLDAGAVMPEQWQALEVRSHRFTDVA